MHNQVNQLTEILTNGPKGIQIYLTNALTRNVHTQAEYLVSALGLTQFHQH